MVMLVIAFEKTLADGAATAGGRRPSVVAAPSAASPELIDTCEALKAVKRGPKIVAPNPLAAEHAQLQRDNKRLTLRFLPTQASHCR